MIERSPCNPGSPLLTRFSKQHCFLNITHQNVDVSFFGFSTKDQLISKCLFGVLNSSKKMNEKNSTRGTIVVSNVSLVVEF